MLICLISNINLLGMGKNQDALQQGFWPCTRGLYCGFYTTYKTQINENQFYHFRMCDNTTSKRLCSIWKAAVRDDTIWYDSKVRLTRNGNCKHRILLYACYKFCILRTTWYSICFLSWWFSNSNPLLHCWNAAKECTWMQSYKRLPCNPVRSSRCVQYGAMFYDVSKTLTQGTSQFLLLDINWKDNDLTMS